MGDLTSANSELVSAGVARLQKGCMEKNTASPYTPHLSMLRTPSGIADDFFSICGEFLYCDKAPCFRQHIDLSARRCRVVNSSATTRGASDLACESIYHNESWRTSR